MSNSIVRMETSSVSTSPRCPSFCSQLHYKSKALNGRSHKQLTDSRQPRENKEVWRVWSYEKLVCVRVPSWCKARRVCAHTSMPDSSVKKTAGSCVDANLLWQKVVGLCGSLVFDLRVWNGDEETTGAVEVNSFFLNLTREKEHVCTSACTRVNK